MAAPPVERVGNAAAQIWAAHLTTAASSITRRERDSERPASDDVGIDSINDPLSNSIMEAEPYSPALPLIMGVWRYHGRFLYMNLIFLSTFLAVVSLIEIMFIFLLGWYIANQRQYIEISSVIPAWRNLRMILNRWAMKL